jgi:hypothetical protein
MRDSYNNQATSDTILCFGENEEVYAHKVILKAASGISKQAFDSKLPVSTQEHCDIQGHSDVVNYAMIRLVYGIPLEEEPPGISEDDRIDYFFDLFAIANEYQIPSLGEAVTEQVVEIMNSYHIQDRSGTTHPVYIERILEDRKKFAAVFEKTAELYINHEMADRSLMDGVLKACHKENLYLKRIQDFIDITSLIGKHDPFCARLLRLYIPSMRW